MDLRINLIYLLNHRITWDILKIGRKTLQSQRKGTELIFCDFKFNLQIVQFRTKISSSELKQTD